MGIEPTSEAWEAPILPLNYARSLFLDCSHKGYAGTTSSEWQGYDCLIVWDTRIRNFPSFYYSRHSPST